MFKRSGMIVAASILAVSTPAMADNGLVNQYFTSMQISVDTANQLGPACIKSLKAQKASPARNTNACTSFNQAYGIVLDQADRLNGQMAKAHQRLPAKDHRLTRLQRDTHTLNQYASEYDKRTGK